MCRAAGRQATNGKVAAPHMETWQTAFTSARLHIATPARSGIVAAFLSNGNPRVLLLTAKPAEQAVERVEAHMVQFHAGLTNGRICNDSPAA